MRKGYVVSKTKDGEYWYAHRVGYPNIPIFGSFTKKKTEALHTCADWMALTYKEYMEARKKYPKMFKED